MNDTPKDALVLEYTRLCLKYIEYEITLLCKATIKTRLNEIRSILGMELI